MGQIKCTMTPCECHGHPLWVTVKWTLLCSSIWISLHLGGRGTKLISTLFMTTARTKATTSRGLGAQAPISAILLNRHHCYLCFTDAIPYLEGQSTCLPESDRVTAKALASHTCVSSERGWGVPAASKHALCNSRVYFLVFLNEFHHSSYFGSSPK